MAFQRRERFTGSGPIPPILLLSCLLFCCAPSSAAPSNFAKRENITIEVPEGSRYLADGQVLCSPSTWKSIATFFLANYVAHAYTVRPLPGQTALSGLAWAMFALLLPMSGMITGIDAICQHAIFCKRPLDLVSRSGGLCEVVRTLSWTPQDGDVVKGVCTGRKASDPPKNWEEHEWDKRKAKQQKQVDKQRQQGNLKREGHTTRIPPSRPPSRNAVATVGVGYLRSVANIHFVPAKNVWSFRNRNVHGVCCLPPGYALAMLPKDVNVRPLPDHCRSHNHNGGIDSAWECSKRERFCLPNVFQKMTSNIFLRNPNPTGYFSNEISASYSLSKGLVAILQTIFATFTLFETRGDQLDQYGYAAFGLTVTPYLIMSLVNLLGVILTPEYPAIYLVRTEVLDEASKRQGGYFEGMVAQLHDQYGEESMELCFRVDSSGQISLRLSSNPDPDEVIWTCVNRHEPTDEDDMDEVVGNPPTYIIPSRLPVGRRLLNRRGGPTKVLVWSLLVALVTIAIIGVLSRFKPGLSTLAQRVWTMLWLSFGIFYGVFPYCAGKHETLEEDFMRAQPGVLALFLPWLVPSIGGFVVVGQMLKSYGTCRELY